MGVLIFFLIILAAFLVPVFFASADKELGRLGYALRTIPINVLTYSWFIFGSTLDEVILLSSFAGVLVVTVFFVLWSVERLNDIGMSRWYALLLPVVPLNLLLWIFLLFRRGIKIYRSDDAYTGDVFD